MRTVSLGQFKQGETLALHVALLDNAGDPVLGLTHGDITAFVLRASDAVLQPLSLDATTFVEVGLGVYRINLSSVWTLVTGALSLLLSAVAIETVLAQATLLEGKPGLIPVVLTCTEDGSPSPNVELEIRNSDLSSRLWMGATDSLGQASLALQPGNYQVLMSKAGVVFTTPVALVVVGPGEETETYAGTSLAVPIPTSPDICVLYGSIFELTGEPFDPLSSNQPIVIDILRPRSPASLIAGKIYTMDPLRYQVEADGTFQCQVVRGAQIVFTIERCGIRKSFTVPNAATAAVVDLL